jgi:alginate O-acetyltransferase complex protein AlgI
MFNFPYLFLIVLVSFFLFYYIPKKFRWTLLLFASYLFYLSFNEPFLIVFLLVITLTSYFFGITIQISKSKVSKMLFLSMGILTNIVFLVIPKLHLAVMLDIQNSFNFLNSGQNIIIEYIGISYITFQSMAYLFDINSNIIRAERHFGHFALYLAFFPKIVQGPIERPKTFLSQIKAPAAFNYQNVRSGFFQIAYGMIKKFVIANSLGLYSTTIFDSPGYFSGSFLIVAAYFFILQLYFDFSGYTDMALGIARLFGINLTDNFNNPFFANSLAEFWRRWHISFSKWLSDYIFTPIQTSLRGFKKVSSVIALLITFLICGLWHGFQNTFIYWGVLQGIILGFAIITQDLRTKFIKKVTLLSPKAINNFKIFWTFNLVTFIFILFRSRNMEDANHIYANLLSSKSYILYGQNLTKSISFESLGINIYTYIALAMGIIFLFLENRFGKSGIIQYLLNRSKLRRWIIYYCMILLLIFWSLTNTSYNFIYIQF